MSGPFFLASLNFRPTRAVAAALIASVALAANTSAQQAQREIVQLTIELLLPDAPANTPLQQVTLSVRPLEQQGEPQTVQLREGAPVQLNLPAGRYEITSVQPVDVSGQPYGWDIELPLMYRSNDLRLSQENAVRVSEEDSGEQQPALSASGEAAAEPAGAPANPPPVPPAARDSADTSSPPAANVPPAGVPAPRGRPSAPEAPTIASTSPPSLPNPTSPPLKTQTPVAPETRVAIAAMLQRWASSLRTHNLDEQMTCYAPRLSAYFRQRDVSRDFVRRDKERFFQRYPEVRQISLSDIQIFQAGDHPEVRALKTWSFGGHRDWKGQVVTHLQLANEQGRWVIVSERERLVHENVTFAGASASAAAH